MQALYTVEFTDNSNYANNNTEDSVGMVLPHTWGPVNRVVRCDYAAFLENFPQAANAMYAEADSCFNAGCGTMEIFRPQGKSTYFHIFLYKSKASENDDLEAQDYKDAYDNYSVTGKSSFDEVSALVTSGKKSELDKLKTLYDAIKALEAKLTTDNTTEKEAFDAALLAASNESVRDSVPDPAQPSDWEESAADVDKEVVAEYFSSIINSINTIQFVPKGTEALKVGKDRQSKATFTKPLSGYEDIDVVLCDVVTGNPGNIPMEGTLSMRLSVGEDEEKNQVITYSLIQNLDGDTVAVETIIGSPIPGMLIDGQNYYFPEVVRRDSLYSDSEMKVSADDFLKYVTVGTEFQGEVNYDIENIPEIEEDEIVAAYAKYFSTRSLSKCSILIPCKCTTAINNAVKNTAGQCMNRNAIIGYPTDQPFDFESIKEFGLTMLGEKFAMFYGGRAVYSLLGMQLTTSCVGVIAGRYCSVTEDASINQIPSAAAYGAYPGSLIESLDESEVLALHELGFNSVYNTTDGPFIWGVKSLHTRQASYFAKANVMRVIAQLLRTTFDYLDQNLHTPNSDRKKAMIQQNRQAFLDTLIAKEVLKANSKCQCDGNNNRDIDTNGGELLIVDFDCWFVKLIERFKIRITASDQTTTVTGL